ncbi:hypothetical protein PE066_14520 [Ramlibacter tataouinensis]|uniref:hypothetical protein n=1 Tax=Ramlibacter tataouinensis TaxID=94132 RepID=UPI0022F3D0D6|nr:hypothetical protein [Ramlibacter tataouinensis]WBY00674.1 hypothetical protein PE066_14520 [Ramlibacter tataouinensis]
MREMLTRSFARSPARLVRTGLWMFLAGTAALLCAALGQLAAPVSAGQDLAARFPALPTWFVPETALGFTLSATLVCWGVWAMGAGLRQARSRID